MAAPCTGRLSVRPKEQQTPVVPQTAPQEKRRYKVSLTLLGVTLFVRNLVLIADGLLTGRSVENMQRTANERWRERYRMEAGRRSHREWRSFLFS